MAVTREDVLQIAKLARLRISDEEAERFTSELNDILSHMDELDAVDVSNVEAVGDATEWVAPLRSDDAEPDRLSVPASALAPDWEDGFFVVPRLAALDTTELEEPFEDKAAAESAGRPSEEDVQGGAA